MVVDRLTPAQLYLWIWGSILVFLGVGSLLVNPDFGVASDVRSELFLGQVETNGWHGVAGLADGLVALAFARSRRWASPVAVGVAVLGGLLPAVIFFLAGDGSAALGLIPVHYPDAAAFHVVPGIIGLACAWATGQRAPIQARPLTRG